MASLIFLRLLDSRGVRDFFPFLAPPSACEASTPSMPFCLPSSNAPVLALVATPPPPLMLPLPPGACAPALPPRASLVSLLISARALCSSFLSEAFSSLSVATSDAIAVTAPPPPPSAATMSPPDSAPEPEKSTAANPQDDGAPRSAPSIPPLPRCCVGETPLLAGSPLPPLTRPAGDAVGTGVLGRHRDSNLADKPGFVVVMVSCGVGGSGPKGRVSWLTHAV